MPEYCYRMNCDDGEVVVTRVFRIGQAPKTIMVDGVLATRSIKDEHKFFPPTKGWPMTCFASGVNANQAGELRDHLLKAGVPTEVTADGDPVYRSAAHRKKALKARGMHDRKSFC